MLEHCQAPRSSPRRPTSSRSTVPRCRRTSRRLRDVPSSRFTTHRPSGATLQRRFGGSASNAPRAQPTGNLDGRRIKCSTMMAAALHGQNENYPPTHIPKSTRSPFFAQQPLTITSPPWPSGPSENASPAQRAPRRDRSYSAPVIPLPRTQAGHVFSFTFFPSTLQFLDKGILGARPYLLGSAGGRAPQRTRDICSARFSC